MAKKRKTSIRSSRRNKKRYNDGPNSTRYIRNNESKNLLLDALFDQIEAAKIQNKGKTPYGFVTKLVEENLSVAPWLTKRVIICFVNKKIKSDNQLERALVREVEEGVGVGGAVDPEEEGHGGGEHGCE